VVGLAVLGLQLDSIVKVFSNLMDSMITDGLVAIEVYVYRINIAEYGITFLLQKPHPYYCELAVCSSKLP